MDKLTAEDFVKGALNRVHKGDSFLLEHNAHERTIVYKFAEYLQQGLDEVYECDELKVDCEYNREGHGDVKTLPEPEEENEEDQIYPDVIVHKRGCNDKNLLVIEVKKENNTDNWQCDKDRLRILTNDEDYHERYDYDVDLFLLIHVGENWDTEPDMDWYPKGS